MPSNELKDPQIYISKEARFLFDNMKKLEEFKNFDNKDFFMLGTVFGYYYEKRKPMKKSDRTQSGFTRERYLTQTDLDLLKAIAISEENDISLAKKIPDIFSIAEEYANGGIKHLKEFIYDNPADFLKKFNSLLYKTREKTQKKASQTI